MNNNFITRSIDLHLFFMRIMKEHMFFIEAAFTPQNFGLQAEASKLRERASNFLAKIASMANGNISADTLYSGEIATKYTLDAENASSYYTKIPLDTNITMTEHSLTPATNMMLKANQNEIMALNNEARQIVTDIINYKERLLNQVLSCSIFTVNYPLLIEHILREAKHYLEEIEKLQNMNMMITQRELVEEEIFWNRIMAEHSKFIRGLLDPTEEELQNIANMFANKFDELTQVAKTADQNVYELAGVTNQTIQEVENNIIKLENDKQEHTVVVNMREDI
jgi:hypothetical protein